MMARSRLFKEDRLVLTIITGYGSGRYNDKEGGMGLGDIIKEGNIMDLTLITSGYGS